MANSGRDRYNGNSGDREDPIDDEPGIQELLDHGYEQLDGFVEWLESKLGIDTRTAQQDCFNAESLLDFLANHQRKAAADINEYDLRWFVFSHYIRKSIADRETQERLPDSLERFFQYLDHEHAVPTPEWVPATLDDRVFYLKRLQAIQALAAEDEGEWKSGFREWCLELQEDLDLRCLWLPDDMGEGMHWADKMGWREATLRHDANDLWQSERAELMANGLSFEAMKDKMVASYLIWLDTPQDRLDGASPRQTILGERAEQALVEVDPDDTEDD
jgi:hypothetical protein